MSSNTFDQFYGTQSNEAKWDFGQNIRSSSGSAGPKFAQAIADFLGGAVIGRRMRKLCGQRDLRCTAPSPTRSSGSSPDSSPPTFSSTATPFASALLAAFGLEAPVVGETGTARAALDDWGSMVDGGYQSGDPSAPQAHVNIVVFDRNYNFLEAAFEQISDNAEQVGVSPDVDHDYLMKEYTIKEAGFVFVYVSNNSPVNVYFDDVTISHTPTNVIQYNACPPKLQRRREYYPFGLQTDRSWTRTGSDNDFLYNAGSELNSTTGWYETFFRGYDAALGRFAQVDPVAIASSSQSPYSFGFNNPVLFNDPNGDYPEEVKRDMRKHGATGLAQIPDPFLVEIGNPYRFGPGSGNHWADGIGYSDWTLNGGSDTYQAGLAAGMTDIGGQLYYIESDGSRSPWVEKNGEYGIMMDVYDDWYVNGEYVDSYYSYTYFKAFKTKAQQGSPTIFISFSHMPKGFDKAAYLQALRSTLVDNGFSQALAVEEYSMLNRTLSALSGSPTAIVTITSYYDGMEWDAGGYSHRNDPLSMVVYSNLDATSLKNNVYPIWMYVNATLHEIGHGLFGFHHTKGDGYVAGPPSVMDYRYTWVQGTGFNLDQRLAVAASKWGAQ